MEWIIFVFVIVAIMGLFVFCTLNLSNQSKKDWETLKYLKNKANSLKTLEEVEEFYKEFTEKANKIHNEFIIPHLKSIDGYLRGMYKILKKA